MILQKKKKTKKEKENHVDWLFSIKLPTTRSKYPVNPKKLTENKQNKIMQSGFFLLNCQHLSKYPVNPKKEKKKKKKKEKEKRKRKSTSHVFIIQQYTEITHSV